MSWINSPRFSFIWFGITAIIFTNSAFYVEANTYHVDIKYGDTVNDGLSWSTAKKNINDALLVVSPGDEIRVAQGAYLETLVLKDGVGLYGGYPSGGGPRDFRSYVTVIDGNISGTVITGAPSTIVDGFTITGGSGTYPPMWPGRAKGGAIILANEMVVQNNIFVDNMVYGAISEWPYGGALYIDQPGSCYIANNFFYKNYVGYGGDGGAIYVEKNTATIVNNTFVSNSCTKGIVTFSESDPIIANNIFYINDGYAIRERVSGIEIPSITHNVFYGNTAVYDEYDLPELFTDVPAMDSAVPEASNNLDCNPGFISDKDFHLKQSSCCIDTGTTISVPLIDLDGDTRPMGSGYDIGADEVAPITLPFHRITAILGLILTTFLIGTGYYWHYGRQY